MSWLLLLLLISSLLTDAIKSIHAVKILVFWGLCCYVPKDQLSLTWPPCLAAWPSSLLRQTSDLSASTSALRATSLYKDRAEREEEVTAASVSRKTGQDSLPPPALCPVPGSTPAKTAFTGPMQSPESSRW